MALIDIYLPGHGDGLKLADTLRGLSPGTVLIGISGIMPEPSVQQIGVRFKAFIEKPVWGVIVDTIEESLSGVKRKPRVFIVHGHDGEMLRKLKDYIQNTLHLDEPVILSERPSFGRTIIEKFEQETEEIDLVFVLLTPDDRGFAAASPEAEKQRARQNVVFELGYFYGKLRRTTGRILLLRKGEIEFSSDLSGVIYIEIPDTPDIPDAIRAAGEDIRREIPEWFPPS